MLSTEEVLTIRQNLEADRVRLIASAHQTLDFIMDRDRDRVGHDELDESTEEEMTSTELRLKDRENQLLSKIELALARLSQGVIDQCEDCEQPIGFKRLLARPVTTLCINCKEEREREGG